MEREEAINLIKQVLPCLNIDEKIREGFVTLIPELKESEDERVRKALIDGVRQIRCKNDITQEQMITYLEKQKDLDKMIIVSPEVWDNAISDAFENGKKEGEKQKEQKPAEDWREKRKEECPFRRNLDNNLYGCERYADVISACTGACSWVVDYPKLKEIQDKKEQKPNIEICPHSIKSKSYSMQKPTEWKPQPESLEALMYAIEGKWEAIKPTSYLSRRLEDLYDGLVNTFNVDESFIAHENDYVSKSAEWSEEDKHCIHQLILFCENCMQQDSEAIRCATWLKSLRPQSHWKPSEEQIRTLEIVISDYRHACTKDSDKKAETLKPLLEQLEKL